VETLLTPSFTEDIYGGASISAANFRIFFLIAQSSSVKKMDGEGNFVVRDFCAAEFFCAIELSRPAEEMSCDISRRNATR